MQRKNSAADTAQGIMNSTCKKILITGTTGFAGRAVAAWFLERGFRVIGPGRRAAEDSRIEFVQMAKLDRFTHWQEMLAGVDFVIHLAARAHQMGDGPEADRLYFEINTEATENLARQAAAAGVRHFVFISTTKAMITTSTDFPLVESMQCNPQDPYGISKYKAELELARISSETGMPFTVLRPPLMYGPGVKGNMATLIRLIKALRWIPLGGISNRRSLLAVNNLASAVANVVDNSVAFGKTYLVSDGEQISTSDLARRLIDVFHPSAKLLSLPGFFWKTMARLPYLAPRFDRLSGSLALDSSLIETETGWKPPFTMIQQLVEMKDL